MFENNCVKISEKPIERNWRLNATKIYRIMIHYNCNNLSIDSQFSSVLNISMFYLMNVLVDFDSLGPRTN